MYSTSGVVFVPIRPWHDPQRDLEGVSVEAAGVLLAGCGPGHVALVTVVREEILGDASSGRTLLGELRIVFLSTLLTTLLLAIFTTPVIGQ